ncbi:hypothetical protein [Actinoplanes utahensis]|nr:hypothetical protein [Actinoplanes utahensis]
MPGHEGSRRLMWWWNGAIAIPLLIVGAGGTFLAWRSHSPGDVKAAAVLFLTVGTIALTRALYVYRRVRRLVEPQPEHWLVTDETIEVRTMEGRRTWKWAGIRSATVRPDRYVLAGPQTLELPRPDDAADRAELDEFLSRLTRAGDQHGRSS